MKTETASIVFTKEDVLSYCKAIGEENECYKNEQYAKATGLTAIPLPPTMPVIMYKLFTIPWQQKGVMIHRKQTNFTFRRMFIEEEYTGYIALTDVSSRKGLTFQKETLFIHDKDGNLCFKGTSQLVLGDEG